MIIDVQVSKVIVRSYINGKIAPEKLKVTSVLHVCSYSIAYAASAACHAASGGDWSSWRMRWSSAFGASISSPAARAAGTGSAVACCGR